jgi:hypothetical protein
MYLIDIHPHRFTNQKLLRIVKDNWPEIIEPHTLNRAIGLPSNWSDDDIGSLRKAGIDPILQISDGPVLMSMGGGITTAGNSRLNKMDADIIKTEVRQLQELFTQPKDGEAAYFKSKYGKNWEDLKFKVKSFETPMEIEEMTTGEVVQFTDFSILLAKLLTKLEELRKEDDS